MRPSCCLLLWKPVMTIVFTSTSIPGETRERPTPTLQSEVAPTEVKT